MPFTKFPSLESFGHVWRNNYAMLNGPVVDYRAKIKLHGTNAAIRCENGEVYAQKRTSDITPDEDNAGFAKWLEPHKDAWKIRSDIGLEPVTYFGEWAGPGVQKGDAVSLLSKKYFFIFAVQLGDRMIVDPAEIEITLPMDVYSSALDDVIVLPWTEPLFTVDFSDTVAADSLAETLTLIAETVGVRDPLIYNTFEVDGPGEGIVMVPIAKAGTTLSRDEYSARTFKVKAARHGAKKAKVASRTIAIPDGAVDFVEMFVTESRCMQALIEGCAGVAEKPRTPDFLQWLGADVKKESVVELSEAGLEWKQVAKLINAAGVKWFHARCDKPLSAVAA